MDIRQIGLVGFGEVGSIFGAGLKDKPGVNRVAAWDLKFADSAARARANDSGVAAMGSMAQLCEGAHLVISAVTASNTLAVAQEAAPHLRAGSFFLDFNSA